MKPPSPAELERCQAVCARFNAAPFYKTLGLRAESDRPGTARVVLAFDRRLVQVYGGIHGGALMSLADSAISIALATTLGSDEETATVQVSMQFLAPPGAENVEAEGRLIRKGRRLSFGECLLSAGGREIARAQGICRVRADREGS